MFATPGARPGAMRPHRSLLPNRSIQKPSVNPISRGGASFGRILERQPMARDPSAVAGATADAAQSASKVDRAEVRRRVEGPESRDETAVSPDGAGRPTDERPSEAPDDGWAQTPATWTADDEQADPADEGGGSEAADRAMEIALHGAVPMMAPPADQTAADVPAEAAKERPEATLVAAGLAMTADDSVDASSADAVDAAHRPPQPVATAAAAAVNDAKPGDGKPADGTAKMAADGNGSVASAADATPPTRQTPSDQERPADQDSADPSASSPRRAPAASEKSGGQEASKFDELFARIAPASDPAVRAQATGAGRPASVPTPEQKFVDDNMDKVVTGVRTQFQSAAGNNGGQMRIRLDPPELGALEVAVKMIDGRLTASFTTSNDQATSLLSHSLNSLKQSLEAGGIGVDRIHVRQSSAGENDARHQSPSDSGGRNGAFDPHSRQGDQQRKEAIQRMWRKLAYGSDEVDLVA